MKKNSFFYLYKGYNNIIGRLNIKNIYNIFNIKPLFFFNSFSGLTFNKKGRKLLNFYLRRNIYFSNLFGFFLGFSSQFPKAKFSYKNGSFFNYNKKKLKVNLNNNLSKFSIFLDDHDKFIIKNNKSFSTNGLVVAYVPYISFLFLNSKFRKFLNFFNKSFVKNIFFMAQSGLYKSSQIFYNSRLKNIFLFKKIFVLKKNDLIYFNNLLYHMDNILLNFFNIKNKNLYKKNSLLQNINIENDNLLNDYFQYFKLENNHSLFNFKTTNKLNKEWINNDIERDQVHKQNLEALALLDNMDKLKKNNVEQKILNMIVSRSFLLDKKKLNNINFLEVKPLMIKEFVKVFNFKLKNLLLNSINTSFKFNYKHLNLKRNKNFIVRWINFFKIFDFLNYNFLQRNNVNNSFLKNYNLKLFNSLFNLFLSKRVFFFNISNKFSYNFQRIYENLFSKNLRFNYFPTNNIFKIKNLKKNNVFLKRMNYNNKFVFLFNKNLNINRINRLAFTLYNKDYKRSCFSFVNFFLNSRKKSLINFSFFAKNSSKVISYFNFYSFFNGSLFLSPKFNNVYRHIVRKVNNHFLFLNKSFINFFSGFSFLPNKFNFISNSIRNKIKLKKWLNGSKSSINSVYFFVSRFLFFFNKSFQNYNLNFFLLRNFGFLNSIIFSKKKSYFFFLFKDFRYFILHNKMKVRRLFQFSMLWRKRKSKFSLSKIFFFRKFLQNKRESFKTFFSSLKKNSWFFFFKIDDLVLQNTDNFFNIFSSFLEPFFFSNFFSKLDVNFFGSFLLNNNLFNKNNNKNNKNKNNKKKNIFFYKPLNLLFIFKPWESFLFLKDSIIWYFCSKKKKLFKSFLFKCSRVWKLSYNNNNSNFLNFSFFKFLSRKTQSFLVFKNMQKIVNKSVNLIFFIKNNFLKFVKINNQIFFVNRIKADLKTQQKYFFVSNSLFFKIADKLFFFSIQKKNIMFRSNFNSFFSNDMKTNFPFIDFYFNNSKLFLNSNNNFYSKSVVINYLQRFFSYKFFFKQKNFLKKREFSVLLRSFNSIWQFLTLKYQLIDQKLQLNFYYLNGEKFWYFLINDKKYYWDKQKKIWYKNQNFDVNYFYSNNCFMSNSFSSKISFVGFRTKIYNYRRHNFFFKYGSIFRWNKKLFFKRMSSYFQYYKRRVFFIKWWHLIFHRILHVTFPFSFISRSISRKLFLSINFVVYKSFFYRIKSNSIINIDSDVNFAVFKNIVVFKEFFSKFLLSVNSLKSFMLINKFMDNNEKGLKKNDLIYYHNAKRLFTSIFWNFLKRSQKKDLVYFHKYGFKHNLSNILLFYNSSILKSNRFYNYILFLKYKNMFYMSGFKKFFLYHKNLSNKTINNYYFYSRFLRNNSFSLKFNKKI